MADPKIKYDIEAKTSGKAGVDELEKSLEELGNTLEGDLKVSADAVAASLRKLSDRNDAVQTFALLKRESVDLGAALNQASANVDGIAAQMPAAAAATQRFAEAERAAHTAVADTQQSLLAMRQALADLRAGNEGAARGTDEYRSSVNQARSAIAELRTTLVQKKADLREAVASTRDAAIAEKDLEDKYRVSISTAKNLSASYGEKNRALDDARKSAQALGIDISKLSQEEQALAQGVEVARAQIQLLAQQQEAASAASRERAAEEERLAKIVEATRGRMAAAARAEAEGILRDAALVAEANRRTKAEAEAVARAATEAGQRVQQAFGTLGVRSAADLRAEIAQVRAAMQTVERDAGLTGATLQQALGAGNGRLRELQRELRSVQGELTLADRASGLLRTGLAQIAGGNIIANAIGAIANKAQDMGREFLAANVQMEGMRRALNAVYKDANVTASQIDFLRKTADEAGVSAGGLSDSFRSFSASTKAANIPLETTNALFASVTKAGATLGLSGERVSLVLQALAQMAAKGTVSMEELRQQLGESLPGALSLSAKGLGLTEAQLIKLVESGGLAARDLFPALAKSLREMQGETDGVVSSWERLKNALTQASQNSGDAGGMQVLTLAAKALAAAVGAVVLPITAFVEIIFGAAKAAGVLVGALVTLSNPMQALGEIADSASARQKSLTDSFRSAVFGADAATASYTATAAATAQTGREAVTAATGVSQVAQAHSSAAAGAQTNAVAQSAAGIATRIAADASMDAGAKWVQLGVQLREVAAIQDQQVKNAEKLAAAAKIEGEGLQALAALRGGDLEALQAASAAAEANALALDRVAVARAAQLATLAAELDAKKALIAGNAEEQKAREIELQEIQKKIDALSAEAAAGRAAAEAAKTDAATRRAAVGAYQDNAAAVGALRVALEQARIVQEAFESDRRRGLATDQQVEDAKRRTAEAQRLYNDALNDAVAAEQRSAAAKASSLQIERAGLDLQMAQAKAAEARAVARGNEYAATQARIKQKEIEIAILKAAAAALAAEADATDLVTNAKIEALVLQGKWTDALAAEMQLLRQGAEIKRAQAAATREGVAELERQLRVLRGYEDTVVGVGKTSVDATNKMAEGWHGVGNAARGAGRAASEAAEANAKALEKIYDKHRLTPGGDKDKYTVGNGSDLIGNSRDIRYAGVNDTDINQQIAARYGEEAVGNELAMKAWELRLKLQSYKKNYGNMRSKQSLLEQRNIAAELDRIERELAKSLGKDGPNSFRPRGAGGSAGGGGSSSGSGTGSGAGGGGVGVSSGIDNDGPGNRGGVSRQPPGVPVHLYYGNQDLGAVNTDAAGREVLQQFLTALSDGKRVSR